MGTRLLEKLHAYTTRKTGQSATAQLFCFQGLSFEMAARFEEYVRNGHPIVHNGEALGLFVLDSDHRSHDRENFIDEAAAVSRRNDANHHFILLQPYGTSSSLSVETTVGVIGIESNAYGDLDELRDSELYKEVVSAAVASGDDASSYASSLIHASVGELLASDDLSINEVWCFLDGLLDITSAGMSLSQIEAYCGYPSSQGLGTAEAGRLQKTFHKDLLEAITDSVVMGEMMDSLFSEAERDDTGFTESDVTTFKDFIDAEIPRLDATPHLALSASYRQDRQFLPWWNAIGLNDIIKAIRGTEDRTARDRRTGSTPSSPRPLLRQWQQAQLLPALSSTGRARTPPRSRKEVFQPHLPVRLPCYDLAPVTTFALGGSPPTSGARGSHGLTGGVYKARERIHRAMADARLLANPASRSRVADSDPN